MLQLLIGRGATLNKHDGRGYAAMHHACEAGQLESLAALVEAGVVVDTPSRGGDVALHVASRCGHTELVSWLVEHKADTAIRDGRSRLAVGVAVDAGHVETTLALVAAGAKCDLESVAALGDLAAVQSLLTSAADPNSADGNGCTALMKAAAGGEDAAVVLCSSSHACVMAGACIHVWLLVLLRSLMRCPTAPAARLCPLPISGAHQALTRLTAMQVIPT